MSDTFKIVVPSPDGDGEIHTMHGDIGIPMGENATLTTNRLYLSHDGDGLELTAEDARRLAGALETAADALEDYHDVRMPVDRRGD